jgi:hypothetical protein
MYAAAVNTTTAIGNPTVLFLTTDNDEFYQAALRVANGEDQRTWGADDRHAVQLPHLHPIASCLFIRNNRLLLRATVTEDNLIVVPAHAVEELLLDFHQHHNGIPALLQALQQRYHWPTWRATSATASTATRANADRTHDNNFTRYPSHDQANASTSTGSSWRYQATGVTPAYL